MSDLKCCGCIFFEGSSVFQSNTIVCGLNDSKKGSEEEICLMFIDKQEAIKILIPHFIGGK
jgi:hypothetical protein